MTRSPQAAPELRVADTLYEARVKAGLSQRELGELIGKPRTYITRLEAGNICPTICSLVQLAAGLKTTCWELLKRACEPAETFSPRTGKHVIRKHPPLPSGARVRDPEVIAKLRALGQQIRTI